MVENLIITRSPLRITLGGGGTDLPSYYETYKGYVLSAAIDKYVYIAIMRPFAQEISLKYSKIEKVNRIEDIQHPIIKEALTILNPITPQIEITSLADIPAGTGLGSSSSFTTALLKALFTHYRRPLSQSELAELACEIEIDRLNNPIGKQDQYISAFGGIIDLFFEEDKVITNQCNISYKTICDLEDNILLFFTGFTRNSQSILRDQDGRTKENDNEMIDNLHETKEIGLKIRKVLISGDTEQFGKLLHKHWENKKKRSKGMDNDVINSLYNFGLKNGAIGGKIVGAGGGGFLMFYTYNRDMLRTSMKNVGIDEMKFKFDFEGTKVL